MLGKKQVVWWIKTIAGSWTCPDLVESGCQPCLVFSSFPALNPLQSANICKAREFMRWFTSLFGRHCRSKGLYSAVEEYMSWLLWSMGVHFSAKRGITNSGCDAPAYMLWKWIHSVRFKEERKGTGEKWEERKKKLRSEIFQQAAFISQLVEIGTGFTDCRVVGVFLSYTELNISNWKQERFYKKVNRTIVIANALRHSAFEELCFAEFLKDNRAQSNFRFCFRWQK